MKGDLICQKCHSYGLKVIYKRDSVTPEDYHGGTHYGEGRRKQKFARLGVYCTNCGSVFFEKEFWDAIMKARKERRKHWSDFPKGKPVIGKFVALTKDYTGKISKVEA